MSSVNEMHFCPYCMDTLPERAMAAKCPTCEADNYLGVWPRLLSALALPIKCRFCGDRFKTVTNSCRCGQQLPKGFLEGDSHIIPVMGLTNSGKSIYTTVLIETLKKYARTFSLTIAPFDTHTEKTHTNNVKRLYQDKRVLDNTLSLGNEQPLPLIFEFSFQRFSSKKIHLIFYDVAGENFSDKQLRERYLDYLRRATGAIWLVDPPNIIDNLSAVGLKQSSQNTPDTVFQSINSLLAADQFSPQIPMAVCLTKFDLFSNHLSFSRVPELFESEDYIHSSLEQTLADAQDRSKVLESFIEDQDSEHFLEVVNQRYKTHCIFGISALGSDPVVTASGVIKLSDIRPIRVEEPLLWILDQLQLIPGEEC